jgi:hypothetical protein
MRHFGSAKKTAKPTDDVLKSQIFQAIKTVSKVVKVVKTFLVLKCTKKIASLRESESTGKEAAHDSKITREVEYLETLKAIDHQIIAAAIVRMKVHFGNDPRYNTTDKALDNTIDHDLLRVILKHKRVEEALAEIQSKITATIEKNNELRAKEQSKGSTKKATALFSKKDGYVDGTKAVFMESLDSTGSAREERVISNADLVKLNKRLRNQANRSANKAKRGGADAEGGNGNADSAAQYQPRAFGNNKRQRKEVEDPSMMMYKPLDERFPSAPAAAASSATGRRGGDSGNRPFSARGPMGDRPVTGARSQSAGASRTRSETQRSAHPAAAVADLTKAASFGKEWKTTGVHPSWAAKQHAKQQTVGAIPSVAAGAAGQGKKIVFDD